MAESSLPPESAIRERFITLIGGCDRVFFAGLPGVGKSLLLQQLALLAGEAGRAVTLLQWDVLRQPFESPRHPLENGATHPLVMRAAGNWLRAQLPTLACDLLIGELPLIGGRLIELAQARDDAAEPLLRDARTQFVVPVPSREVRAGIEAKRAQTIAAPQHSNEADDAPPNVLRALWQDLQTLAQTLGLARQPRASAYCPATYAAVYLRLLRRRHASILPVETLLPTRGSVYAHLADLPQLRAKPDEAQAALRHAESSPAARAWWKV
ncbi:MAG: hypothetical protein OXE95_02830 [Chloroflexi bacterium]|nr:hypothetical protein [Chloroflexota bacterium]MCY4246497.1 hypothetical protein [Chloroflexota bacterium]